MKSRMILLMLVLPLFALSCGSSTDVKQERAYRAERANGDIVIAAVASWPFDEAMRGLCWQGIEMAADEINAAGGVLGRKVRILKKDDGGTVRSARLAAQEVADNPDVVAVIGHLLSDITMAVSITYSYNDVLFMAPFTTSFELTHQKGFRYIFRCIQSDEKIGRQLAEYAVQQGYKRVMAYFGNSTYGLNLANAFEKHAARLGCFVVDRLSYDYTADAVFFRKDLYNWKKNYTFDAIFLAGTIPQAPIFIREARAMGINVPIFSGPALDSPLLATLAGSSAEGVVTLTAYSPGDTQPEVPVFNKAFENRYNAVPDQYAAQAYDAVKLLAFAMQKAGSTVPGKVAQTLYNIKDWVGVTGVHTFDDNGDVVSKPMDFQVIRNGKFEFLKPETDDKTPSAGQGWSGD